MTDPREHKDKWILRSKAKATSRAKDTIIEAAKAQLAPLKEEVRKLTELFEASGKDNEVLRAHIKTIKRAHIKTLEEVDRLSSSTGSPHSVDELEQMFVEMEDRAHKAEAEVEGHEQTFDLIQAAQERAIECWQQSTKHSMVLPDWFDLTRWLLDRHDKGEQAFTDLNAEWSEQHVIDIYRQREQAQKRYKETARADEAERELVDLKVAIGHLTRKAFNE